MRRWAAVFILLIGYVSTCAAQAKKRDMFRRASEGPPWNTGAAGKSLGSQSLVRELLNGLRSHNIATLAQPEVRYPHEESASIATDHLLRAERADSALPDDRSECCSGEAGPFHAADFFQ